MLLYATLGNHSCSYPFFTIFHNFLFKNTLFPFEPISFLLKNRNFVVEYSFYLEVFQTVKVWNYKFLPWNILNACFFFVQMLSINFRSFLSWTNLSNLMSAIENSFLTWDFSCIWSRSEVRNFCLQPFVQKASINSRSFISLTL